MKKHKFETIMLVTTEGVDTEGTEQTALKLAKRSGAKVIMADSIRTPFHLPSAGSISTELMYEIAMKVKQAYLDKVATQFRKEGVEVETQVFVSSRTSEDIVRLAKSEGCDLVVRYLKGEHSRTPERFGQTARNLMRVCPCPLLLIDNEIPDDPKVMACVGSEHGMEENQVIFDSTEQLAKTNAKMHALSCWRFEPAWYLSDDEDVSANEPDRDEIQEALKAIRGSLNDDYELTSFGNRVHVVQGDPINVIPKYCTDHKIDVAVMSAASLDHPLGRLLGSTIQNTIEQLPCALMVVKPMGFKSPVSSKVAQAESLNA